MNEMTDNSFVQTTNKGRVLCAMSGGVDSSLTAALLKEQGYDVLGAMMRFWPDDKPQGQFDSCCSPDAAYEARRVADVVGVPFYLLDYRKEFEDNIIEPFVNAYQAGDTPNPCVWCNTHVKFDALLKKARMLGCDYVATGHYVRRIKGPDGLEFHRAEDDSKDQTYFLWGTPKEALPHIIFPIGEIKKPEVRTLAEARGLPTAKKPESQNICFIQTNVRDFLDQRLNNQPGPILDADEGYKEIGRHDGVQFYTIGQRKGLGLYHSHLERFVIDLRPEENTVVVGSREMAYRRGLRATGANFLADIDKLPLRVLAQTRYRQQPKPATLKVLNKDSFELHFDEPVFAITKGQSAVLYDGNHLLGGGFISERL